MNGLAAAWDNALSSLSLGRRRRLVRHDGQQPALPAAVGGGGGLAGAAAGGLGGEGDLGVDEAGGHADVEADEVGPGEDVVAPDDHP